MFVGKSDQFVHKFPCWLPLVKSKTLSNLSEIGVTIKEIHQHYGRQLDEKEAKPHPENSNTMKHTSNALKNGAKIVRLVRHDVETSVSQSNGRRIDSPKKRKERRTSHAI